MLCFRDGNIFAVIGAEIEIVAEGMLTMSVRYTLSKVGIYSMIEYKRTESAL